MMSNPLNEVPQEKTQSSYDPDSSMQAMYLIEPGQFELRQQPIYDVESGGVLVQIAFCGICPWDVRVYSGKKSVPLPRIMGHEASGRIVKLGEGVKHLEIGQPVMADFIVKCGVCANCRQGRSNRCHSPQFPNGGYADFAVLPYRNIHPIQVETTSFKAAAFTEPLSCVVRGQKMLNLIPGEVELVIGAGPIGLMHMQLAKLYGAKVIVADLIQERLELARELGADFVYDNSNGNLNEFVLTETNGRGADAAVVAVGVSPLVVQAAECLAEGGRLNIFAGIYPPAPLEIDPNLIHYQELVITGSADSTPEDMHDALNYIETGQVEVERLISHLLPLEELQAGFEIVLNQQGLKVMAEVGGESI
jgi:L-iditol 2-dehydrogenase